uniref:Structural maintenance of chromosomes flexible hinge domain containing 1 n=1 Tax=Seriola lalandi dorsalis TaxID=1841481 RepID=A0A3B4YKE3_SERLL
FAIRSHEIFVLATTDRTVLDFDKYEKLQDGSTLYLLQREDQALPVATEEHIMFTPHFDTLIQCGTYEYYSSEGQNSLPYAIAELIDNALSATAKKTGTRTIELRMLFDESLGKPAVIVLDNGCGMTSKQLNNWAVYRLSKFTRENSSFGYVRPVPVPRSLNSDISYFGVGGKQAVFFIGDSTRMISKAVGSPDVHELILSKEEFERKEKNKEDVYRGTIRNRKPGDSSHVRENDQRFLHELISEEPGKQSFTAVVITGIKSEHITFLKEDFAKWTRELAHIYHYYIHGVNGNDMSRKSTNSDHLPKIDIQVTLREKSNRCPRVMNLREVDDDMQTLYINATADMFEFKATTGQDRGTVEGLIRYHPFLYDRETFPPDPYVVQAPANDEDESGVQHQARGKRPIFECFWNGRLIPYAKIDEFQWCTQKGNDVPDECYSRFSGVLFTDDRFQVTTNKLTFMDLEMKVKSKDTIFTRVVNGQAQRSIIEKDFRKWLQNCHKKWDKQVKFLGFREIITRKDLATKKMQHPWATFSSIELDGKLYKTDQLVKSQKTNPIHHGTVVRFLLYGEHKSDVFATGGQVEVCLEPKALYAMTKIIPISKIDRTVTDAAIKKNIENDFAKLPDKLKVDWPDGNPWPQNAVRPAGMPLGALRIEILNKKGESISRMPTVGHSKYTFVKLEPKNFVISSFCLSYVGPKTNADVISFVAQHSPKWGFWFRKIENLIKPGRYTLFLSTIISESNATIFGGRNLPSYELNFTIKEGNAESFVTGTVSSTLHVGTPFDIPLHLKDQYGNLTMGLPDLQPVLKCRSQLVLHTKLEKLNIACQLVILCKIFSIPYFILQTHELKVILPGLKKDTQTIKISLLPGKKAFINFKQSIIVENRNPVKFNVEIRDEAGNITAHPRQTVHCKVQGLPPAVVDCSSTGAGQLLTKPINLNIIKGEPQTLKVQFEVPSQKSIALVVRELKVMPSTRVSLIKIYSRDDKNLVLRNNERVEWLAGGSLEGLFYKLYDEAYRAVPLTAEIASKIKVNWKSEVDLKYLVQGKLPDIMVPTQVHEQRFFQVSYQDQSVCDCKLKGKVHFGKFACWVRRWIPLWKRRFSSLYAKLRYSNCLLAVGLDKSAITFIWQEGNSSVKVTGIRFQCGTPGWREMCFTYQKYVACVKVEVTAGNPAQLQLVSGPELPLQVLNGHGIPTPFLIQLSDEWGNPSSDQRVVVELWPSPPALKLMSHQLLLTVLLPCCSTRGYYQLEFKGSFNNKPIPGPSVNLTVLPDPNKPVSLSVKYDTTAMFPAGGLFPVFSVTVVSDEGSPMTTFNPAAASMWLWEGVPLGKIPPQTVSDLLTDRGTATDIYLDKEIPERAGKHIVQFSLRIDATNYLYSNQITLNVVANQPVKLAPDSQPPAPVVSCCTDIANRTLVENMTLRIMDSYGNPAGQDLGGQVVVSITSSGNKNLPLFEGKRRTHCISLAEGQAHITRLAIMENSPGEDGSAYTLCFQPQVSMLPQTLFPFELTFHFYNGMMFFLLFFNKTLKLDIDKLLKEKNIEADRILKMPRRVYSVRDNFRGQQDVLGMVGHLAYVQDDAAARVISWFIRGDMDCVITRTSEAARRIHRDTQGRQQVMPLDSIYVQPQNRPLPHMRNGHMLFDPPGNPVHARDLLIYPNNQECCDKVFKNILGETLLIDDLESANNYRRMVVQNNMHCPTILTREGDCISAKGKFGGKQNKAPPTGALKMFGAPIPQPYYAVKEQIDLLSRYRAAVEKREKAEKDREDHLQDMKSPQMKKKQEDMREKIMQLEALERHLGMFVDLREKAGSHSIAKHKIVKKRHNIARHKNGKKMS